MFSIVSSLDPVHIEVAGFEIDLLPPEGHELGRAQPMAIHHQNNGSVSDPVATGFPSSLNHRVDLLWPKIVPHRGVLFLFPRGSRPRRAFRLCRKRTLAQWR
jgi:hypothetical protein